MALAQLRERVGPQGEQGIQGEKGDPGREGKQGEPGLRGKKGIDGKDGKDGKTFIVKSTGNGGSASPNSIQDLVTKMSCGKLSNYDPDDYEAIDCCCLPADPDKDKMFDLGSLEFLCPVA